ncbi:ABC transporter ATP-binding protein [Salimicrobium humidisoli]|uniref:ABC transporter ATP-binding protein n=1 Tax=Salimicrobium humidisoli TaxID=2029857 RepID=A0ABX4HV41_9BACI|nr:ABC transporter ATP-binding protein [Salimicrobium humidisoli]PBB07102.1 ABC transporter ATP-binding protein [Salimicrobium humidisoli]
MRLLLQYVSIYKRAALIAIALMFVELTVELFQPLIMGKIIDEGILQEDYRTVLVWGTVLIVLSLLAFSAGIINSFFAGKASQGTGYDLRRDIFNKVQKFTGKNFDRYSTPDLVTRITTDVVQIQNFLFLFTRIGLRAPLFIIFSLVMAFTVHRGMALILLLAAPVLVVFMVIVSLKGVKLFRFVQNKLDGVNRIIRENLTAIRLIKGFNRTSYEESRFHDINTSLRHTNKQALWLMEFAMPALMLMMNTVILIVLWFGGEAILAGTAEPGELVAIVNYATRMLVNFSMFTFLIMVFSRSQASSGRIARVLTEGTPAYLEETDNFKTELEGNIEFRNVSVRRTGDPVLHNISFHIDAGEMIGILGETGAGKSTLLQLIPRLIEKEEGTILFENEEVENIDIHHLRHRVSMVPQEVHLFSGTIGENIRFGKPEAAEEEIEKAARQARIDEFIKTLPDEYDTKIGQKGVNFSGGQKQRLSIARALVRNPAILILDDSTSALDANTEEELLDTLQSEKRTVLMTAQKISSLKRADRIFVMQEGRLIGEGSHERLLKDNDYYRSVYESQREEGS